MKAFYMRISLKKTAPDCSGAVLLGYRVGRSITEVFTQRSS